MPSSTMVHDIPKIFQHPPNGSHQDFFSKIQDVKAHNSDKPISLGAIRFDSAVKKQAIANFMVVIFLFPKKQLTTLTQD